jgi:DNA processing protein
MGCNNLIKTNKAHLLTSSKDIIEMLNWDIPKTTVPKQIELFITLNDEEQKVYDYLHNNGKQLLDTIALHCDIPIYKLSSILIQMELKNIIKPLPGKLFEI